MKKFFRTIAIYVVAVLALVTAVSFVSNRLFSSKNTHYLASFYDKTELARATKGKKRVVFMGGSNLTFGIDSKLLKDSLGVEVINLSIHGALRINNAINVFMPHLDRENDIVVLSPEYETLMVFEEDFDSEESLYCKALYLQNNFNPKTYAMWVQQNNPLTYYNNNKRDKNATVYHRANFNTYGDIVNYPAGDSLGEVDDRQIEFNYEKMQDAAAFIKEKMNGFKYYISAPVTHSCWSEKETASVDSFLLKEFGEKYIVQSTEMRFAADEFYNTIYHLNKEGKRKRTLLLLDKLRKHVPVAR
jgi:hypothetical protein